jgi:hypothetical protein
MAHRLTISIALAAHLALAAADLATCNPSTRR